MVASILNAEVYNITNPQKENYFLISWWDINSAMSSLLSIWQNHRIRGLLEKCTLDHEARTENFRTEMRERALSDAKWRHIQQDLNNTVSPTVFSKKNIDNWLYFKLITNFCPKWSSARCCLLWFNWKYISDGWLTTSGIHWWKGWCSQRKLYKEVDCCNYLSCTCLLESSCCSSQWKIRKGN